MLGGIEISHLEAIATDGQIQRRILWLDITRNGVYTGFCHRGADSHTSYHADGNVFWTFGGKSDKIATLVPLKDFKGIYQIAAFAFSRAITRMRDAPVYEMKKLDFVTYVDVRSYSHNIGCLVFLLEPKRFDKIEKLTNLQIAVSEFHIFPNLNPWVVIAFCEIGRKTKPRDIVVGPL